MATEGIADSERSAAAMASAECEAVAVALVRWVDRLPGRDTRGVLLKTGAVLIGLATAAAAYQDAGLDAAALPLIWAAYYLFEVVNALIDKTQR